MAYRDNVQALCDECGIANPIQEPDLGIAGILFMNKQTGSETYIEATDMNRGARLFLEAALGEREHDDIAISESLRQRAKEYFAELYDDVGNGKRALLEAFHFSDHLRLTWKPRG